MNPWEINKQSGGNLSDYLQYAGLNPEKPKIEIISTQTEILRIMDDHDKLVVSIKEDQDSLKVGEFIDLDEIQVKVEILTNFTNYLKIINENHKKLIDKSLENRPGNQIYVDQENHYEFFKMIEITRDKSLLQVVSQANKIHDATLKRLQTSLSKSTSKVSENIIKRIENEEMQIDSIMQKYI